jgi:tetratricopeptide (TPR) repeat protein
MWLRCVLTSLLLFWVFNSSQSIAQENFGGPGPQADGGLYYKKGVSDYESGQYAEAVESFKKAVQLDKQNHQAYYNLGMAYGSLGQYREAVESYERAIKIKPDYAAAHYNSGHALSNLKRFDDAVESFKQAIRLEPDNIEAYFGLGYAYLDSGKDEKAVHTFEEAIRLWPENPNAYFNLGLVYFPEGPYAEAIDAFTHSIRRDPRYPQAYHNRAYAYLYMGRGESAATDAETYLSLKGWRAEQSVRMAVVAYFGHSQAHQDTEAARILDEAVRQCDRSAWPYPVIEYLRSDISARRLYSLATDDAAKSEARTYIGVRLSMAGAHKAALYNLRWAKEHTRFGSLSRPIARSEIDRIQGSLSVTR